VTFTNATDQIQSLPEIDVKARYGAYGRPTAQFTDPAAGISGIPEPNTDGDSPRTAPEGSFTTAIGIAIPATTPPGDATITFIVQPWIAGEGSARAPMFFEGAFLGATTAITPALRPPITRKNILALGEWNDDGDTRLRLSPIRVDGPAADGTRTCSMDLTVVNGATGNTLTTSMDTVVNISYGQALTQGPVISPGPGPSTYSDAPIAPGRAATETLHFTLPAAAVPGPVTIDVAYGNSGDGHRTTYEGTLS
jgi:hypothetical protein